MPTGLAHVFAVVALFCDTVPPLLLPGSEAMEPANGTAHVFCACQLDLEGSGRALSSTLHFPITSSCFRQLCATCKTFARVHSHSLGKCRVLESSGEASAGTTAKSPATAMAAKEQRQDASDSRRRKRSKSRPGSYRLEWQWAGMKNLEIWRSGSSV